MLPQDIQQRMLADLAMTETAARGMAELAILRARLYVDEGLPLESVLSALHISRSTYYRRLREADRAAGMTGLGDALELLRKAQIGLTSRKPQPLVGRRRPVAHPDRQ